MEDKEISSLPAASELNDEDLFVASQNGSAKKVTAELMKGIALDGAVTDVLFSDTQSDGNIVISVMKGATT